MHYSARNGRKCKYGKFEDNLMEEKKLTGYPSIDKPHYKYYRTTPVRKINKNQTIYELVFDSNIDNMDVVTLEYLGMNWTFAKLKTETDQAADAFAKACLIMGDVVLLGVSNCFEAVVSLLALNKLGSFQSGLIFVPARKISWTTQTTVIAKCLLPLICFFPKWSQF